MPTRPTAPRSPSVVRPSTLAPTLPPRAVMRMPTSATAVTGAAAMLPVKIWNSAMKPDRPGRPSEANAPTANSAASLGARSARPP